MVESYKYLGCTVNEHMDCRAMVRERSTGGRGALSAWLWRCRVSVGEVRGKTFVKLMEALVESALMYGAEVCGSCKWLDCIKRFNYEAIGYSWGLTGCISRHNTVKVHCCVLQLMSRQVLEQITAEESFNTRHFDPKVFIS